MNVLGLVFSLLLILSYTFYTSFDNQISMSKIETSHIAHQKANRKLLNQYQSEVYHNLKGKKIATKEKKEGSKTSKIQPPKINKECAKINLYPLIEEGRDVHPSLYELTAKLFHEFYGAFIGKKEEYKILDSLLEAGKLAIQKENLSLEKFSLENSHLQMLYYKMLKGSKDQNIPSLLDYIKLEKGKNKICLFHAHPRFMEVFLGPKIALKLFEEIHRPDGSLLTPELIEKFCDEERYFSYDKELLPLFEYGRPDHQNLKNTLVAEDRQEGIYLRKTIYPSSFH